VAEQVQRSLDRNRVADHTQELDRGNELPVELPGSLVLAGLPEADELLDLRPDDMRVHADTAHAAELEERQDQIVVAGVEIQSFLDDVPCLGEVVERLLDRADVL